MSVKVDSKNRVRLRQAMPGEEYDVEVLPSGFKLTRLVKERNGGNYRLIEKSGYLMIETEREANVDEIKKCLLDLP